MGIALGFLLVVLCSLSLVSVLFPGGPRLMQLLTLSLALLALWLLSRWHIEAALVWLVLFGGLKLGIWTSWKRLEAARSVVSGQPARFLSLARPDRGELPFVMYLPPLRAPLYFIARRARVAVPQAGNRMASEMLVPLLDMLFQSSSGFTLDTRHLAGRMPGGQQGPAFVIRCL
ncbi:MAG: hypothetical protein KDC10_00585 [Calditrichaeota bacterium]|nr:hypothetical protein [Candidatus Cloacimonadota bacterium]MCA9786808.1 hypothetical protein [Candidatus Cloacimonadota bacterium]MCB1045666.1 hypothetical protein [Calditrichota bacterium]MCB9472541.1 hypothetical protein [Candidatus Delongbacteria bacterium]